MPLEDLVAVIKTLKDRIEKHRGSLERDETRTRMALINPLLGALGWHTEDPGLVLPEYKLESGKPDYALLNPEGKPIAMIEAKKLGEPLAKHEDQALFYIFKQKVSYGGLTDGNHWKLYENLYKGPDPLCTLSIENDAAHECALKLLLFWQSNLASGRPIEASTPVLADPAGPQPLPPDSTPPPPSLPEPVVPPSSKGWVALTELDIPPGSQAPLSIRFEDGQEASTAKSWQSLLEETGKWLDGKGLIPSDSSIPSGHKRYILHHNPIHPSGKRFRNSFRLTKSGAYLDVGIEATIARRIRAARMLLEGCGQDPARVYVRPRA